MTAYFRYYDTRYGDVYEIYLDSSDMSFVSACRSVEALGRDPIYYDALEDIPQNARHAIEEMIEKRQKHAS